MKQYVWAAHSKKLPFLPAAIADTKKEIARMTGQETMFDLMGG